MIPCRYRMPAGLSVLLVVSALAAPAMGSQVQRLDTAQLTASSHEIVLGHVEATTSRWNASRSKILTDVTVRVDRTLKGQAAERITLTQLGGELDGFRTTVHGSPLWTNDEEVLLFVWRDPRGRGQVNGLSQGKFEIRRNAKTGEAYVQRSVEGLRVRDARSLAVVPEGQTSPEIRLEDLLDEIERAVAGGGR